MMLGITSSRGGVQFLMLLHSPKVVGESDGEGAQRRFATDPGNHVEVAWRTATWRAVCPACAYASAASVISAA